MGTDILGIALHYETLKIVDIKNKKVGCIYRAIQFIIMCYVLGYVIIWKKGYQATDHAISSVSIKLKGTAYVDYKNFSPLFNGIQVYDPSDYVIPAQEQNGFFVMTNMVITPNQTQGKCPESSELKDNRCSDDSDCQPVFGVVRTGNGVRTGSCVYSDKHRDIKVCEIYGWCPTEDDTLPMPGLGFSKTIPLLDSARNFTVLVKNDIYFPKFKVQRRNIFGYESRHIFRGCTYDNLNDKYCPIFKLQDIIRYSGDNFTDVAFKGGVYGIHINWDCDLNYSVDNCVPKYHFSRLDDPQAVISPGYNFRYSNYFVSNNKRHRTLTKAFGLKFHVIVSAKAGKFSPIPLFLKFGAGLALLGLAKVFCDFMVIYCLKERAKYKKVKVDSFYDDTVSIESGDSSQNSLVKSTDDEKVLIG